MPFLWRASICHLQTMVPFLPGVDRTIVLLAGRPLRAARGGVDHPLRALARRSRRNGHPSSVRDRCARAGLPNVMTQRGRASATVQVVSDLQCPATEGVAYVLQGSGIRPGGAAPPAAVSAGAATPGRAAASRCRWAPPAGNDCASKQSAEKRYTRSPSRSAFACAARAG